MTAPAAATWQQRARAAGLRQVTIARLLGWRASSVSRAIRRRSVSAEIRALILCWEGMDCDGRHRVLVEAGIWRLGWRQRVTSPRLLRPIADSGMLLTAPQKAERRVIP